MIDIHNVYFTIIISMIITEIAVIFSQIEWRSEREIYDVFRAKKKFVKFWEDCEVSNDEWRQLRRHAFIALCYIHTRIRLCEISYMHVKVRLLHMMSSQIHDVNAAGSLNNLFIRQGMFNISYYLTEWRSWFSYFGLISINNSWGGRISGEGRQ